MKLFKRILLFLFSLSFETLFSDLRPLVNLSRMFFNSVYGSLRKIFTRLLEMVPWNGCKAGQIASSPRTEECVGCKRCESACPTDFLSVRVYLGTETTRSMGLTY